MNEKTKKNNKKLIFYQFFILTVIVVTGFGLRIINLGGPGFGTDEPLHVFAAQSILENGKPELPSGILYKRALLYTKTVALSFKIFGVSEFSARLPSVIFGTLTIILLFFIGKKFYGTTVGLLSAILVAYIPYQIAWSRECRMYTMFQFIFIAGVFAFYNGFERNYRIKMPDKKPVTWKYSNISSYFYSLNINWMWVFFSIILLYISYSVQSLTATFGPSLILYLVTMGIIVTLSKGLKGFIKTKYFFLLTLIAVTVILTLSVSPGILVLIKSHLFFKPIWASSHKFNPLYYINFLTSNSLFPLGVFFVFGIIQTITHENKVGFYTFILIAVPLLILTFIPTKVRSDRYIFNILPLIILLASYSINNVFKSELGKITDLLSKYNLIRYNIITSCLILLLVLMFTFTPWVYYSYRILFDYYSPENNLGSGHRNWRQACDYIAELSEPNDVLIPSEPLTVFYYGCSNIHYYIADDYSNEPQFLVNNAKRIFDVEMVKNTILKNKRGWMIIDKGRFYSSFLMSQELREYIFNNLVYHDVGDDKTVLIFSWDQSILR